MTARTYTVPLPWPKPPLTANQRLHWRAKAERTRAVRETAGLLLRRLPKNLAAPVTVTLSYEPPDARRRDADNLCPLLKPCLDGGTDAGLWPDDTPDYVAPLMPVILPKGPGHARGRFWLTLEEAA